MEGFIGQIILFAGNFAPRYWAFCDGQLLSISSNTALFSILGTIYGGDGRTTFALPDLRGRFLVGPRTGPGLSTYREGQTTGAVENYLNATQIPSHTHAVQLSGSNAAADASDPTGRYLAQPTEDIYAGSSPASGMSGLSIGNTGNNVAVNNMQPWLAIYFIICLQGIYPSRD